MVLRRESVALLPYGKRVLASWRASSSTHASIRPFEEIPGPRALPVVGNTWLIPWIGKFQLDRLHVTGMKALQTYGKLVRFPLSSKLSALYVFDPQDIECVFHHEGRSPMRLSHQALEKYRLERPAYYNNGGLLPTNGPNWNKLRSVLQKPLNIPQVAYSYIPKMQAVTDDFIEQLQDDVMLADGRVPDLLPELRRWALESIGVLALDTRFGCLGSERDHPRIRAIMQAAYDTQEVVMTTETGFPFWKYFRTPAYKKLERAQELLYEIAKELVLKKQAELKSRPLDGDTKKTVLEAFLTSADLDLKDTITAATDLLFAGIDTTSYALSFMLYYLSTHPEIQERLYEEIYSVVPDPKQTLNSELLNKMPWLRACVKESLRLKPIAVGTGRIVPQDMVLSGYHVPCGTIVITQNQVASSLAENFEDPQEFRPERWLRGTERPKVNPYVVLPFGHGPRSCIGRRIAESEIYVIIVRLLQKFRLAWLGSGELDCRTSLINLPDRPVDIKFTQRNEKKI